MHTIPQVSRRVKAGILINYIDRTRGAIEPRSPRRNSCVKGDISGVELSRSDWDYLSNLEGKTLAMYVANYARYAPLTMIFMFAFDARICSTSVVKAARILLVL